MKMRSVLPGATASSTAYWMSGLSTMGSISFGEALVAGRKRVPSPATGKTALVIFCMLCAEKPEELFFVQHSHAEFLGAFALGAGFRPGDDVVGLLRDRPGDLAAAGLDALLRLVARERFEDPGEHHDLTREGSPGGGARGRA